jgi:hypothetical protein
MCLLAHNSSDLPEVHHGKTQYPPNHDRPTTLFYAGHGE